METFSYKDALLNKPSAGGPARKYKDHSAMKTAPFISNAFPTDDNEVTGNLTEQNEGDRPGVISVDRIQKPESSEERDMSAAIPAKFRKNNKPTKNVQLFDFLAVSLTPDKKSKGAKISTAKNIPKEPSTGGSKREIASKKDVPQGNLLDKSGPQLHKGKTRPNKKKRDTRTKKLIKEGREVRKLGAEESLAEIGPSSDEKNAPESNNTDTKKSRGHYLTNAKSKALDEAVTEFLMEVKRFQDRVWAKDPAKGRIKRRLVCGFRECRQQIELENAKCLILATNIERVPVTGGLDEQMESMIAKCNEKDIPVVSSLNRNSLGRALKKTCVSCVVVLNFQGAEHLFKKVLEELEMVTGKMTEDVREGFRHLSVECSGSAESQEAGVKEVGQGETLSQTEAIGREQAISGQKLENVHDLSWQPDAFPLCNYAPNNGQFVDGQAYFVAQHSAIFMPYGDFSTPPPPFTPVPHFYNSVDPYNAGAHEPC